MKSPYHSALKSRRGQRGSRIFKDISERYASKQKEGAVGEDGGPILGEQEVQDTYPAVEGEEVLNPVTDVLYQSEDLTDEEKAALNRKLIDEEDNPKPKWDSSDWDDGDDT